jgi:hypothetical protein
MASWFILIFAVPWKSRHQTVACISIFSSTITVAVDANILASTYFWSQTSIRFWFSTTRLFRICNSQTNSNLVLITHFSLIWVTLNEKTQTCTDYRAIEYQTMLIALVRYDSSHCILPFFTSLHICFPTAVRHRVFMRILYYILICLLLISITSLQPPHQAI